MEALQRHCCSKRRSPCLSSPQTFSRFLSWPIDTSKDEDAKVDMQMHVVHPFPLVNKMCLPSRLVISRISFKLCGPWYHLYYVSSWVGGLSHWGWRPFKLSVRQMCQWGSSSGCLWGSLWCIFWVKLIFKFTFGSRILSINFYIILKFGDIFHLTLCLTPFKYELLGPLTAEYCGNIDGERFYTVM